MANRKQHEGLDVMQFWYWCFGNHGDYTFRETTSFTTSWKPNQSESTAMKEKLRWMNPHSFDKCWVHDAIEGVLHFFRMTLGHIHPPKHTMHHKGHFFQLHGNALAHHLVKSHMIVSWWPCSPIQWTTPGTVCTRMLQGKVSGMSSDNATTSPEHLGFGEAFKVDGLSGWWLQHKGDVTKLYIDWMIMNGIRSIQICC